MTFCPRCDGNPCGPEDGFGSALTSAVALCACALSAFFKTDMPTASPVIWLETAARAELETSMIITPYKIHLKANSSRIHKDFKRFFAIFDAYCETYSETSNHMSHKNQKNSTVKVNFKQCPLVPYA